jgi:lipoprotein-releasing system ATP-binding protein
MLLHVQNLSKHYNAPSGGTLAVLNDISLKLDSGDALAIVGPSGSGKSTLLQIIGTLDQPSVGRVVLGGQDLSQLDEIALAAIRNRQIGFVFQSHYLLPQCTVWENVLVPTLASPSPSPPATSSPSDGQRAGVRGSPPESTSERAERLLKRVGLSERLQHFPGQLSGGERQRVAVVRALINRPALLLADEPTGALDQHSAESLGQLLVELNGEEGVTLVVVTHSRELARRMGRVLTLRDGKLCDDGK